jgi:site-specific DNA-methyltransferase (adenine-specific)
MKVTNGDIFKLGDHRLMCGNSTDSKAVQQLMADDKVRSIVTDPPYGVDYVASKKDFTGGSEHKDIENDEFQSGDQYQLFTRDWLKAITPNLESYNTAHIFNSDLMYFDLRKGMEMAGFYYSQMIIWVKNSVVVGRKDYLPKHELIAYGWFGRHKFERNKGKSVIFHAKPTKSQLHPTMKPVGLLRKLVLDVTKMGEGVYDPFAGSGSTLIACEHTKRKAYLMEMDTEYVKTIIARWEKLTGDKAEKI